MNPLFQMMQGNNLPPLVQQFLQFKQNYSGDPKEQIQQLLNSGQISQTQYDNAVKQAQSLQQMLTLIGRK